jgi:site-specific DNA recombinase
LQNHSQAKAFRSRRAEADHGGRNQTIRWILKTPHYAGEVHWWRRNRSANKAAGRPVDEWRPLDEQVTMPAECIPALVDKETFAIVQGRLRLNRERSAHNNREPEATLLRGGFVRCGYCGDSMAALHARPKRPQAPFYKCPGHEVPARLHPARHVGDRPRPGDLGQD